MLGDPLVVDGGLGHRSAQSARGLSGRPVTDRRQIGSPRTPGATVEVPFPARAELRGVVRRYLRLNAALFSERDAWLDLLRLGHALLSCWGDGVVPEPTRALIPPFRARPELPRGGDGPVSSVVNRLAELLDVRWSDASGTRRRPPACVRTAQNDWGLHGELRSVFADAPYDRGQVLQNLWHWHLAPPPAPPLERAAWLARDLWGRGATLEPLYQHEDAAMVEVIAAILRSDSLNRGRGRFHSTERAWCWLSLFSGADRVALTTARDPEKPEEPGTLMAPGATCRVTSVLCFGGERVGVLHRQHWGVAD